MSTVITITNQKGGTGKTTTAAALLAGLSAKGHSVLGIDFDPQMNLTYAVEGKEGYSIYGILIKENRASDAIQHTKEHGDFIIGSQYLSSIGTVLTGPGSEFRLREQLAPVRDKYEYIIIDTPPALGILTVNALTASDKVVIPVQASMYDIQGIVQLGDTIAQVKQYTNRDIVVDGILVTRYNARLVLSRYLTKNLRDTIAPKLKTKIYHTTIRDAVGIREAAMEQRSMFVYAPDSPGVEDYRHFVDEFLSDK
ncbi:ParA family protein [Megasphaera sp.]|uniref:ParA family protein n=1 Tax=Megasphaera sp. TaxID=2023260 RepID=UPI00307D2512